MTSQSAPPTPNFTPALIAGAVAGITVDISLFPLDTVKTRLQSRAGFAASGGFQGVYRGVGSALVGSAPGAALFFVTYEAVKYALAHASPEVREGGGAKTGGPAGAAGGGDSPAHHMLAASLGEMAACAVRVPTEVVKQRAQAGMHGGSSARVFRAIVDIIRARSAGLGGVRRELYRGWGITVMREVPFTMIQFPLWEALKRWGARRHRAAPDARSRVGGVESAAYGCVAGAVAAALTTPLDVLKTRVMLERRPVGAWEMLGQILRREGAAPLLAGMGPRVAWIGLGGAIFLGSYTGAVDMLGEMGMEMRVQGGHQG